MRAGWRLLGLPLIAGVAAAFMMFPILEDWPIGVTVALTALVFGAAGYLIGRHRAEGLWYTGILINVPFWLLFLLWGITESKIMLAAQASAIVSAYGGVLAGSWRTRIGNRVRGTKEHSPS